MSNRFRWAQPYLLIGLASTLLTCVIPPPIGPCFFVIGFLSFVLLNVLGLSDSRSGGGPCDYDQRMEQYGGYYTQQHHDNGQGGGN